MSLLTPTRISALLREHDLRPRQSLGQNFLADANTVRRIVGLAGVRPGDRVVEIGPGLGSLTCGLVDAGAEVVAVEADPRMAEVCRTVVPEATVLVADAVRFDFHSALGGGPWQCVSNLPYNVATPVVVRLLEEAPAIDRMLVMVQAEVGERWVAPPGGRARGAVTLKFEYYAETAVVGRVPPTVFIPPPSVESVLVSVTRRPSPAAAVPDADAFFGVVRTAFSQRRKTLRQSLAPWAGSAEEAAARLVAAGIDPGARAEQLSLGEFARLMR